MKRSGSRAESTLSEQAGTEKSKQVTFEDSQPLLVRDDTFGGNRDLACLDERDVDVKAVAV